MKKVFEKLGKATLVGLAVVAAIAGAILFLVLNWTSAEWVMTVCYRLFPGSDRSMIQLATYIAFLFFWSGFFGYLFAAGKTSTQEQKISV